MHPADEVLAIAAACSGDQAAFARLVEPYRRELLIHCYRMLGSLEEAEDTVQETLLRAWRGLRSFEGRASFRAWCYKIATHAALEVRERRPSRLLPSHTHAQADPGSALPAPVFEPIWLDPLPDDLLSAERADPEALYDARESVTLAFLATLQRLPGRQRAVLILRDVLAWQAEEVADLLGMTITAVNSALQRARAAMRAVSDTYRTDVSTFSADARIATLLAQYVQAWEAADVPRLASLLRDDAVKTMPPLPCWYRGRNAIQDFFRRHLFAGDATGRYRLAPTRANGSPAFASYARDAGGIYRPSALHVLDITQDGIAAIHCFLALDDRLFARFGLALSA